MVCRRVPRLTNSGNTSAAATFEGIIEHEHGDHIAQLNLFDCHGCGGINYYALPPGTTATLFVDLNFQAFHIAKVRLYTQQRGWGCGQAVEGDAIRDRVYSKDGYGVIRGKVGVWL